ncbi:hypothetical protein D0Y65_016439 [Glycine soja]|uniref:DUF4283 domain-containing protein n=2 Tax=Glycine subgen. Soja TaxID=1462606 RepID=A0A0R0JNW3_SOYBN|nr:hypothetical protein D0Y65_016439 [Glycine soja]
MHGRLKTIWKLTGNFEVVDFDLLQDRENVISRGLWMIFDHYIVVQNWVLDFVSSKEIIKSTLVWLPFLSLAMEENLLLALVIVIYRPVKVDIRTADALRGKFVRVFV